MPDDQPQIITPTQSGAEPAGEPPAADRPITVGYEPAAPAPVDPMPQPAAPATAPEPPKPSPIAITVQDETGTPLPAAAPQAAQPIADPMPAMPAPQPAAPIPAPVPAAPASPSAEAPMGLTPPVLDKETLQDKINNHPLFSGAKDRPFPKQRKAKKWLVWVAVVLLILIVGAYLAIDSGMVRGASHLPFHIFKQATPAPQPVINTQQNTAKTSQTQPTTADPYADWKTYNLPTEKLELKYPSTWTVSPLSGSTSAGDTLLLSTSDNFLIEVATGSSFTNPQEVTIDHSDAVTFLNQSAYLNLAEKGTAKTGNISAIVLSKSATDDSLTNFFQSKNITNGKIGIAVQFGPNDGTSTMDQKTLLSSDSYKNLKLLVQSFTY